MDTREQVDSLIVAEKEMSVRVWYRNAAAAALLLALLCAIPAPARAADCKSGASSGFNGDINATYPGDNGGGGDSGGSGGGGGGDAGAGAGEGKVLGGLMTAVRLSDGATLGAAVTDSVNGLVTVSSCPGDLPVLLTLNGQAGAKYFDEGTGQLTDFGPGNVLHALIDSFSENVAVSPLTEAAYRYALNNFILNPQDVRAGRVPLASTGNVNGLTMDNVKAANGVVLAEFNRMQTASMRLATLKSLPTPIDSGSSTTALPDNHYGIAAAVLGGLAKMGKQYASSSQNPALAMADQLARDLTDGKLDGFALDGSPAAGPGIPVAYDPVRFPIAASVGANDVSARFGATTTLARAVSITEQTTMGASISDSLCSGGSESTSLLKDGSLTVIHTGCGGGSVTTGNVATQVRLVAGTGASPVVPRTFFVKEDGTVWAWGETLCGLLGNGVIASTRQSTPVLLAAISRVTSIANGVWFSVARDDTGSVYTWGLNYLGALGRGSSPSGVSSCENDYTSPDFKFEVAASVPTKIAGLSDVVSVAADGYAAFALDRSGNLFQWGLIPTGWDFSKPQPYHGEYFAQPVPAKVAGLPHTLAIAASYSMKMALAADGTLWGWGPNVVGNFGDGTLNPHLDPTQVPGLDRVVEIAASLDSPFVALIQDGTIRYWGGCCIGQNQSINPNIQRSPTAPTPGGTRFYSSATGNSVGTLPPIRHVKGSGGQVLLYGVDGSLYQFPKSLQEPVFVVLISGVTTAANYEGLWWKAPANSESGWGINFAHQGDTIFATWFTYDPTGKPWWLVMTANKTAASSFTGTLYTTHGPAFNAVPFSPAAVTSTAVGTGTLTFADANNGTFAYSVNGISQSKAITRQVFGALPTCTFGAQSNLALASNYQDLWWAAPAASESGWGVNFAHQGDTIFATWFTYDLDGTPLWLVVTANKTAAGVYSGTLYRTTGPAFNAVPFDPAHVVAASVGTATLTFANGSAGSFAYTVNGVSQTKAITREVFHAPGTICN